MQDDQQVTQVWAEVYPPSYQPPRGSEELVQTGIIPVQLISTSADTIYGGAYSSLSELGVYRVVIYARDNEGLLSRPKEVTIGERIRKVHLPLVVK